MADKLAAAESRYSAYTRDSILSDPRLSQVQASWKYLSQFSNIWFQLFDISQQLEALAESLPQSSKPAEVKIQFSYGTAAVTLTVSHTSHTFINIKAITE